VDNSGSMTSKRSQVVAAALAFARSSNAADEMFVVNFNENVSMGLPEGLPFTNKEADLRAALAAISTVGKTALYDGIASALEHLKKGTRDKKVLIVISDGGDNASRHRVRDIMNMAEQSNAIIYTIGLFDENDPDRNPRVLKKLAKATGGEVFLPDTTSKVMSICEQIARDIRNQYTIGYVPTNKERNGAYRRIQVIVTTPDHRKVSLRTRPGYLAPTRGPQASPGEAP
jgi:Ca-activated chloride channel family protein